MAQKTGAPVWTLAEEGGDAVVAGGSVRAGSAGAVVDVFAAVVASPAVHTHAVETADGVVACPAILTGVWRQFTLVHIFCTVLTGPVFVAVAVVGVDAVDAASAVLTGVLSTIINIMLTRLTCEAWQAGACVCGVAGLHAGSSAPAGRGQAGLVEALAVWAGVLGRAAAQVRAHLINAGAAVPAGRRRNCTLVHVLPARLTMKVRRTRADVVRLKR